MKRRRQPTLRPRDKVFNKWYKATQKALLHARKQKNLAKARRRKGFRKWARSYGALPNPRASKINWLAWAQRKRTQAKKSKVYSYPYRFYR